jgi:methylmalonyl-CoA/ethylmalonyl-CoA epimerase
MVTSAAIKSLGTVMQLAFLPDDFDAALKHWTQVMGVGPFFLFEGAHLNGMTYRGVPTEAAFDIAMSYWGDIQIELVRPRDDHPSIYTGEYANVGGGLHHVCIIVDDIKHAARVSEAHGGTVVLEGSLGDNEIIYVDPGQGPGHLIEMLQQCSNGPRFFNMVKAAAHDWDGSDPVRKWG